MSAPKNPPHAGAPRPRDWPKHLIILIILGIELLPLYMMLQISGKNNAMFTANPWLPASLGDWQWGNYLIALDIIAPAVANSVFITVSTTVLTLFVALLGAYFFARYKMPFGNFLWAVFLFLMLMPGVANIVPLFMLLKSMNLLNTLWALIIIGISSAQVFNIYILRNFIEDLPKDLFEAAEIDGAGHFKQLLHIVIPMSGPIIGTLAILSFLSSWNEFLMPLILLKDSELFPIGVALIYLDGEYVKQWGPIMATFFLASIPLIILFLFTMKLFCPGTQQRGRERLILPMVISPNATIVAPSLLGGDHGNLRSSTRLVEEAGCRWIHLDIMDGHFVPNLTFGPSIVKTLRKDSALFFDVHLMLDNPGDFINPFAEAGADLISIHVEPEMDHHATLREIKKLGCQNGIVLNPGTPVEKIYPFLEEVDLVLVMTVQPGFGGQSFREDMLSKLKTIHRLRNERGLLFRLEVDGGINRQTGAQCAAAGADTFVAGTAFFNDPDPENFVSTFENH